MRARVQLQGGGTALSFDCVEEERESKQASERDRDRDRDEDREIESVREP